MHMRLEAKSQGMILIVPSSTKILMISILDLPFCLSALVLIVCYCDQSVLGVRFA